MEEEEARLKALLDQTSDFDERKKIRADLRALRIKKLDAINSAAAVESSERAARRAERARARKAEQTNGEVSRGERDSDQAEVVISEQILAEIDNEETLQKLLNEIPTSQIDDRRRIRARIREVRRKKPEEEPTTRSTYSQRTKEVTEEPSEVTAETTVETHSVVTNHSGGDDEVSFKVTVQQSKDMNGEVDEVASDEAQSEKQEVVEHADEERGEKEEENEPAREDIMVNGVDEQVGSKNEDETGHEEAPTSEAAEESIPNEVPVEQMEVKEVESEPVEVVDGDATEETNEERTEEVLSFGNDSNISIQITLDEKVEINVPAADEVPESEAKTVNEEPKIDISDKNDAEPVREEDNRQEPEDSAADSKPASKSGRSSRWPPPEEDKAKKPGKVNTTDFRGNLKKSGRIGTSAVNLEKKTTTAGAQVDFRASSLKKPGRFGTTGSQERKNEPIKQEKRKEVETEPAEETNDNDTEEVNEEPSEESLIFGKDGEISLQIKLDEQVEINVPEEEEKRETESRTVSEEPQDTNDKEPPQEETNVEKAQPKDTKTDTKPAPKSTRGSRWPPAEDDKSKKPGKVNTADFRGNLKKSGRIGSGPVNLEKKANTAGAQVDFRASSLKKPGRFGTTATKQERKDEPIKQERMKEVESEPAEETNDKDTEEVNEEPSEVALTFGKDSEISLQIKLDEQVEIDIPAKEEEFEAEAISEEPQEATEDYDKNDAKPSKEETEGQKPREDTAANTKQAPKSSRNWPPPPEDKTKKLGQTNTADFRGNLKKSGRIGSGLVNLENRTSTTGAQVDFRASSLKKSGRIGTGAVNLERRTVQSGAQVDFRSGLKKSPAGGKTPTSSERHAKSADPKGNADFGKPSKPTASVERKDDSPPDKASAEPEEVPVQPEAEPPQPEAEPAQPETEPAQPEEPTKPKDEPPKAKVAAPSAEVGQRETKDVGKSNRNARNFQNFLSNAKTKDKVAPPPVKTKVSQVESKSEKKRDTEKPKDTAVNGVAVQVQNTSLEAKEPTPEVKIEVTEHVEDEGDTKTEVREVKTSKKDENTVEEKKEATTVSKTSSPGGRQITYQKRETTTTTKKTFVDPELQKRMALRQRERVSAKKEQAASAKNKRMAFMQKLEANSPASKGPTQIKRSGSNVDKLLAWCRFKTQYYEGLHLSNFSSSWADGLAFCALLHLYLPDKIPYDELRAGNDRRRNFETAFGAATEAGVPELLEVDDMLSVQNPEPKGVMTYVSSIYKHFNPS